VDRLFEHTDYRAFLKEWFEERKRAGSPISYRSLGRKIGVDPGFLVHILQGSKHVAETAIPRWVDLLGLDTAQAAYFQQLVLFNRARAPREIQQHFQRLCELRDMSLREVSGKQYRYYLKWYIPAVRVLLLTFPYKGDLEDLARRLDPAIDVVQAKEAVDTLVDLGLAEWNSEGALDSVSAFLTSGDRWKDLAVRSFQDQTMDLARRSLQIHPPEAREMSTLTLAIPASEIPTLKEMVRDFRQKVLRWTASLETSDCVVQVNVAAFPLSAPVEPKS
jgi:uncharacterized protein (TIGR02147 family)